jgi:hypothetical protein
MSERVTIGLVGAIQTDGGDTPLAAGKPTSVRTLHGLDDDVGVVLSYRGEDDGQVRYLPPVPDGPVVVTKALRVKALPKQPTVRDRIRVVEQRQEPAYCPHCKWLMPAEISYSGEAIP